MGSMGNIVVGICWIGYCWDWSVFWKDVVWEISEEEEIGAFVGWLCGIWGRYGGRNIREEKTNDGILRECIRKY